MTSAKPETIEFGTTIDLEGKHPLNIHAYRFRRTPIVVTISDPDIAIVDIQKMLEAGMNIAKFSLAEFSKTESKKLIGKIDKACIICMTKYHLENWPVSLCVELKGTMTRTGLLENKLSHTKIAGREITLTSDIEYVHNCDEQNIYVDNKNLTKEFVVGTEITIGDASLVLECIEIIDDKSIKCKVLKGGILRDFEPVSARRIQMGKNCLARVDFDIVKFAAQQEIQMILVKYTRSAEIIKELKAYIRKLSHHRFLIIANICSEDALDNIDEIIEESDAISLARDMLPYELSQDKKYRYPLIERWIIAKCVEAGKFVLISGGVFHEALTNGDLNLNEVFDVAHLILNGATGLVLRYCDKHELALNVMIYINEICTYFEAVNNSKQIFWELVESLKIPVNAAVACVEGCALAAHAVHARIIVLPTVTGKTVKVLSMLRPAAIILAVSSRRKVTNKLKNCRGVQPLFYIESKRKHGFKVVIEKRIRYAEEYAVRRRWLELGDYYLTLQRGTEVSSYCDTLMVRVTSIANKPILVDCADEDEITLSKSLLEFADLGGSKNPD